MIIQDNRDTKGAAFIMDIKCAGRSDPGMLGGKGAALVQLHAAGFPAPTGFIITTAANAPMLESLDLGFDKTKSLAPDRAEEIRRIILAGTIPEAIREECLRGWQRLREESGQRPMAVRSSAVGEDASGFSFAGQYDSILDVECERDFLEAIKKCWASLWSERAAAYREHHGLDQSSARMAIVVQPMVPAEISGIVFTLGPIDPANRQIRISASQGIGESLAAGKTTPEEWRIDRETRPEAGSVTCTARSSFGSPLMSEEKIRELAELAMRIESHFGCPQDIEWALAKGELVILQSRPITTLPPPWPAFRVDWGHDSNAQVLAGENIYWSNWNTRENMPYPLRPLAWSFMKHLALPAIAETTWGIREDSPFYPPSAAIDLVFGRVYWNMNLLAGHPILGRFMMRNLKILDQEAGKAFDRIIANGGMVPFHPNIPRLLQWKLRLRMLWTMSRYPWLAWAKSIERRCETFFSDSFAHENVNLADRSIVDLLSEARRIVWKTAGTTFPLLSVSAKSLVGLKGIRKLLRRWPDLPLDTLLMGIPGNRTSEGVMELFDLSQKARPLAKIFSRNASTEKIETALAEKPAGAALLRDMNKFLHRHGHRGIKDLDISFPNWQEDRSFIWQTIQGYWELAKEVDPHSLFLRAEGKRLDLTREIERRLSTGIVSRFFPVKKWLFRFFLKIAHDFFPLRENSKYYGIRLFPPVRRIFLEIGRRFHKTGLLYKDEDIFYLSIPEIESYAGSPGPNAKDIQSLVSSRRREWEAYQKIEAPFIVRSDGQKTYSHSNMSDGNCLRGAAASGGRVSGLARILRQPDGSSLLRPGEILVAPYTEPGWTPLFPIAAGLVMEVGGTVSHGAIVAREFGIPAVVGVSGALKRIRTGDRITVDGDQGIVYLQKESEIPEEPGSSTTGGR